jgi:hypothetical protein
MAVADRQTQSGEPDAVEVTRTFFAEHAGVLLTPDEGRECNRRLARFFELLDEWDQAERERQP